MQAVGRIPAMDKDPAPQRRRERMGESPGFPVTQICSASINPEGP